MKKRSNLTTFAVVGMALFGLVLVAMKANPIKPDPEAQAAQDDHHEELPKVKPTTPAAKPDPAPPAKGPERSPSANPPPKTAPVSDKTINPDSIDISTDYWKENKDGQAGVTEMDKQMAVARAKQKAEIERINREAQEKKKAASPAKTSP